MELHRTSGRRGLGAALALVTMLLWGGLPIALKGVLRAMDAPTIVWYRFVASTLGVVAMLALAGRLPSRARIRAMGRSEWTLLAVATVFLSINYLAYLVALDLTTAADAQVLIQLAPLLLALGGIAVFGERFTRLQWIGFAVLAGGLVLFAASRGASLPGSGRYWIGGAVMALAAATWAIYGLAQKQLLHTLPSQQIMLALYAGCALLFTPLASPGQIVGLGGTGLALLAFCAVNTAVAYGAFSEALQHWEASRVSAVIALTPLATLAMLEVVDALAPGFRDAPPLPVASLAGACVVVLGSLGVSLGARD